MTIMEDLKILGQLTFRQVVLILLSILVTQWIVNLGFAILGWYWLEWLRHVAESELWSIGDAAIRSYWVNTAFSITTKLVGWIMSLWVGYMTFSRFTRGVV